MIFSSPDVGADAEVMARLLTLQKSSYAVEAQLIGDDRIPPLLEGEHELIMWQGRWILAWEGTDLVGAIAWSDVGNRVELHKLMVNPQQMRRGVASGLLDRALKGSAGPVAVATGRDNVPAVSFYARHGFAHQGDEQVPPGIWISRLFLQR